ncbi:MAG TPA: hypothetical protein VGO47_07640 [Chlamydiales bacterium]|nr:hypothetical protein [Chlamydiales bacterium]
MTRKETFDVFYPNGKVVESIEVKKDAQNLALLYMIFLLGTLYDTALDIKVVSEDMERFHTLARAALACHPINRRPSVEAIRAIVCLCVFLTSSRYLNAFQPVFNALVLSIISRKTKVRSISNEYTMNFKLTCLGENIIGH